MKNVNDDIKYVLFSEEDINKRAKELGDQICKDYADKKPVLICLLKGSANFTACLEKYITIPCEMDYMKASSYANTESTGNVAVTLHPSTNLKGRHVIVIEDIIDTAFTLYTVTKILEESEPASIELCTMLNKRERRQIQSIDPKYYAFDCPNEFVVGFGLDYNEEYRQLPYVGVLKEEIYMTKQKVQD